MSREGRDPFAFGMMISIHAAVKAATYNFPLPLFQSTPLPLHGEGTTSKSHPRAETTFKSVSSWGIALLLSNLAMTDCVRLAASAKSFWVIPWLRRRSISRSMMALQFSGISITSHGAWNAILIKILWGNINCAVVPYCNPIININRVKYRLVLKR